jgi:hypothetical protein
MYNCLATMHIYTLADFISSCAVRSPGQASCILGRPLDVVIQQSARKGARSEQPPSRPSHEQLSIDSPSDTRSCMRTYTCERASIQTNTCNRSISSLSCSRRRPIMTLSILLYTYSFLLYYLCSISILKHNIL